MEILVAQKKDWLLPVYIRVEEVKITFLDCGKEHNCINVMLLFLCIINISYYLITVINKQVLEGFHDCDRDMLLEAENLEQIQAV